MTRIVYDQNLMKFMSLFESMTQTKLRDAIQHEDMLLFVVEPGEIGKAIGSRGVNIHRLEDKLRKRVKIVEWAESAEAFVQNLIYPAKASYVEIQDKRIMITPLDLQSRGHIIGRGASNLRFYEEVVRRYFPCDEIKVGGG